MQAKHRAHATERLCAPTPLTPPTGAMPARGDTPSAASMRSRAERCCTLLSIRSALPEQVPKKGKGILRKKDFGAAIRVPVSMQGVCE